MYHCGPTVHNYAHIGNLRAYIFADVLRRTLEFLGLDVHQVINVTDIGHLVSETDEGEDKMTRALSREGKPLTLAAMRELADFYFEAFKNDLIALNIKLPEHFPFASDHIAEEVALVQKLIEKNRTYQTNDGIYFDTAKMKEYGKLGGPTADNSEHSRIPPNPQKKHPRDFALWKFSAQGGELGYDAPFGKGFPGWHIECSAMSMKYLGETFDIHTGGIDHIPVHHNNEIAQSEAATGKPLARYWLHSAFLTVESGKMAKSEENFVRLQSLIDRGIHPLAYRFFILQAHYHSPLIWSWEAVEAAQSGFESLVLRVADLQTEVKNVSHQALPTDPDFFLEAITDDLNTPRAIALLSSFLEEKLPPNAKLATLYHLDEILGLRLKELAEKVRTIPSEILAVKRERDTLRQGKKFQEADALREEISSQYLVRDLESGTAITRRLDPSL